MHLYEMFQKTLTKKFSNRTNISCQVALEVPYHLVNSKAERPLDNIKKRVHARLKAKSVVFIVFERVLSKNLDRK